MAYRSRRSTRRAPSRRSYTRRSTSGGYSRSAPRARSRRTGARRSSGRGQTIRIVLESAMPSGVQRPEAVGLKAAAPARTKPQF